MTNYFHNTISGDYPRNEVKPALEYEIVDDPDNEGQFIRLTIHDRHRNNKIGIKLNKEESLKLASALYSVFIIGWGNNAMTFTGEYPTTMTFKDTMERGYTYPKEDKPLEGTGGEHK